MSFWRRLLGGSENVVPDLLTDDEVTHKLRELGLEPGKEPIGPLAKDVDYLGRSAIWMDPTKAGRFLVYQTEKPQPSMPVALSAFPVTMNSGTFYWPAWEYGLAPTWPG